jgi:dihydropteroate synthase
MKRQPVNSKVQVKTKIMGVVNATPDSFSDDGKPKSPSEVIAKALVLAKAGADIIDIGAESTRPGATPVTAQEEWRRLESVLNPLKEALAAEFPSVLLSIDTMKPEIMLLGVRCGIQMINDVRGGAKSALLRELLQLNPALHYLAMHMHGSPATMQQDPLLGQAAVQAVDTFFLATSRRLSEAGFAADKIWLDPGIGFGKNDAGNLLIIGRLLGQTGNWAAKYNVAIGISRKGFLGRTLNLPRPEDRDPASKMLEVGLAQAGVKMIRTHDVAKLKTLLSQMSEG